MILTRERIIEARQCGELEIEPFDVARVSPNAYDFTLEPELREIEAELDAAQPPRYREQPIGPNGFVLEPSRLYLGLTHERTGSTRFAQMIHGDRSLGALGIWVHVSAPLGHAGHAIRWTLEIRAARRVLVYPLMTFGKIVFLAMEGRPVDYRAVAPKYSVDAIEVSRLHEEAVTWTG